MSAASRLALLVAPVLLLAACEDSLPQDAAVAQPTVAVPAGQTACSLLPTAGLQAVLQPAPAPSPSAPVTPVPVAAGRHAVRPVSTTLAGAPQRVLADQCTYTAPSLATVVVSVFPPQKAGTVQFAGQVSELTDFTDGASTLTIGGAIVSLQQSSQAAVVTFQGGGVVISIAYEGSEISGAASRAQRLADLAAAVLHAPAPSLPPSAPVALGSPAASATPRPAPGQKATGGTAASTVQETDQLAFAPVTVTVKTGDVVEWDNTGTAVHNVTFSGQPAITSATMNGGDKYQVKFTLPGTYSYVCTFHVAQGMQGSITVTG